ncbi:hypothetical protein DXG01_004648 [Tephrocybe rancida]|nr:hypothetical protein DXG01_004648 [Tephrocybe rancida]
MKSVPYVPVTNPLTGDVVGHLKDHSKIVDSLTSEEDQARYVNSAETLRTVIEGTLKAQDLGSASLTDLEEGDDKLSEDNQWGPKMTALPDEPLEGDIAELVNLGPDITDHIKPQLEEVLQWNCAAFGLDGHLRKVEAKVKVPLKPDTQPISVPIYSTSPAK